MIKPSSGLVIASLWTEVILGGKNPFDEEIAPLVLTSVTEALPNWIVFEAVTIAPPPIAVAFVRLPEATSALEPIATL